MHLVQSAGIEPVLPEMSAAPVQPVDILSIQKVRPPNGLGKRVALPRNRHQVDVIRHQAIREDIQLIRPALIAEDAKIRPVIVVHEEHVLAIVASLDDMVRDICDDDSSDPWHTPRLPCGRVTVKINNR